MVSFTDPISIFLGRICETDWGPVRGAPVSGACPSCWERLRFPPRTEWDEMAAGSNFLCRA